ncbi:hypothetical protein EYF80_018348 [Liparis tanakae]|uniref:Uncharacterized protein n=1 Tax=Liparis tanakae TaxID=230148 RepID=A0A4Z2HZX1_9TELE|nr:hypothetical protein EYF80_018348 [Liparis tanakae]
MRADVILRPRATCHHVTAQIYCGPQRQWRSAECHRGNKQQQLSRMGLIKHSALAPRPAVYCALDQSRPDRPPPKDLAVAMITGCHLV